ncbi:MAG: MATE family efflux transporter [Treponema bryantii]|nr:MATE family efflux transporter [Treponema bryantii]
MNSTSKSKNYQIDMCSGAILPKLLLFALPLIGSSILQLLFNAADVVVVGRFAGDNALAAVGSTGSLINLIVNMFVGLSIGANVITAKYYGAKKYKDLSEAIHTSMLLSVISGIILTFLGVFGAKRILMWMQSPAEVLDLAAQYLKYYFLGITATMVYNFGSAILRAVGDTRRPLYYLFFAGIINVILNLIFVICFDMSVVGVAVATTISQCFAAICVVRCLVKDDGVIKLNLKELKIHKIKLIEILKTGVPAGFQGMVFSFSNVVIQSSINAFGAITIAGNSAAANIEGFIYVSMNAFYQAAISFTSQNFGAKKFERIKKVAFLAESCVLVIGLSLGILIAFLGKYPLYLYSSSADVIVAGQKRLLYMGLLFFLCGMMDVMCGMLRGLGYSITPMIISMLGACGFRLLWIFTIFQIPIFHKIEMLYISYPISWIITFAAQLICFVLAYRKIKKD